MDSQIGFSGTYGETERANWGVCVIDKTNNKIYGGYIDAMSGEFDNIYKFDYTGLSPDDCSYITNIKPQINNDKIDVYIQKAKEIIMKSGLINSEDNIIQDFSVKEESYTGLRPFVQLSTITKGNKTVNVGFYSDTDELALIQIYHN